MERLNSGDSKIVFGTILCILNVGLMKDGRVQWEEEDNEKRFQNCSDPSGKEILHFRALQGHSRRNFIDLSVQDNVLIIERFLQVHLSHRMCDQFHKFRSDTGKSSKKTDSILSASESYEQGT